MAKNNKQAKPTPSPINRRRFIAGSAAAAASFSVIKPSLVKAFGANSKIEVGFVGLGGRGSLVEFGCLKAIPVQQNGEHL